MAKYKKRADGRYATSVKVGCKEDGKPKLKTIYGKTIRELDAKVADFKSLQNKGIVIDDKSLTVKEWSEIWLELYKSNKSYNTYDMYSAALKHITPKLGDVRLSALKKHMLQEVLNDIIDAGNYRTAEIVRLTIRQLIASAIDEQYIYNDVSRGLSLPKKPNKKKRALNDAEIERIKQAELNPKERAFVDVLLYTGIRRGEALALMPSDVDLVGKVLHINKAVIYKENNPEIKPSPKSEAGVRDIPIPDALTETLQNYLPNCGKYLFEMESGGLVTKSSLTKMWKRIKTKCFMENDVTPHILRHTYATKLFYAGIDIKSAQKLLGHSNIAMTMDVYTHLKDDNDVVRDKLNLAF